MRQPPEDVVDTQEEAEAFFDAMDQASEDNYPSCMGGAL